MFLIINSISKADPKLFFHSHDGLKARLIQEQFTTPQDTPLITDLNAALKFIDEEHGGNIMEFQRLISYGEITWDLLWALFTPNTLVYHYHELTEQDQVLLARSVRLCKRSDDSTYVRVDCDIISCDGKSFWMARDISNEIDYYPGALKIQDLVVFPLKYHPKASQVLDHAMRRGKKFACMTKNTYHEISGMAMNEVLMDTTDGHEYRKVKFSVRFYFVRYPSM